MSAIRKHCPELVKSKVEQLEDNFRIYLSAIDEKIAAGAGQYVAEFVEPRLQELWDRDEQIASKVDALGARFAAIVSGPSNRPRSTVNGHG